MTKLRVHASYLRKRFEKSSEPIQEIVSRMSDEELIEAESRHHEMRVKELANKARTNRVYDGAPVLIGPPQCKSVKRRWFGLRRG